jgi:hypothetical protein
MKYYAWTNKRTFWMSRAIDKSEENRAEAKSIIKTFDRDDFRSLVLRIAFRDLELDAVYIDPDESVNWEEINEYFKERLK